MNELTTIGKTGKFRLLTDKSTVFLIYGDHEPEMVIPIEKISDVFLSFAAIEDGDHDPDLVIGTRDTEYVMPFGSGEYWTSILEKLWALNSQILFWKRKQENVGWIETFFGFGKTFPFFQKITPMVQIKKTFPKIDTKFFENFKISYENNEAILEKKWAGFKTVLAFKERKISFKKSFFFLEKKKLFPIENIVHVRVCKRSFRRPFLAVSFPEGVLEFGRGIPEGLLYQIRGELTVGL